MLELAAHVEQATDAIGNRRVSREQPLREPGLQRVRDPQVSHAAALLLKWSPVFGELVQRTRKALGISSGERAGCIGQVLALTGNRQGCCCYCD